MRKLLVLTLGLLTFSTSTLAADKCTISMAESFLENNETVYASSCLEDIIRRDPANTYAHFLKGKLCLKQNDYACAQRKFAAVPVKKKYFNEITIAYKERAGELAKEGRVQDAKALYLEAAKREPRVLNEACDILYSYGNAQFGQNAFSFYEASNELCGAHKEAIGQRILQMAKQVSKNERKAFLDEAGKYLDQKTIEAVFPPPVWQTVFKETYVGRGYGKGDYILTARFGKDVMRGDKVIITGKDFEEYDNGAWNKRQNVSEGINYNTTDGNSIGIKAPPGVEITVEIQRLTEQEPK